MSSSPETSVIIRAYNEEKHLPRLLDALDGQTYRSFEVVVVDSGSFDRTRQIARQRAARLVQIDSCDFTFGYSLNSGIRNSNGCYVAVISAHTVPTDKTWLEHLVSPLQVNRTAMVYGRQLGVAESKFSEICDFERMFGPHRRVLTPPAFMANNANSALRKDLWEQHPFDESLPGLEDIEWAKYWMERGHDVVYEASAAIYHIHEETWPQVRRRYYREAVAAKRLSLRRRRDLPFEVCREGRYLMSDLLQSLKQERFARSIGEICRFRFEKTAGTCIGILDGAAMANPDKRAKIMSPRTCKAVVINGPHRAALHDIELRPLKPSEVLIKVAYEGVCGTDLEILEGTLGYYKNGQAKYPITPGHEFSGRVAEIGANINNLSEGDRVVAECIQPCKDCDACRRLNWTACEKRRELGVIGLDGAYSEYVIVPGHFVHRIPDTIPLNHASLCEPLAVVLKGIKRLSSRWAPEERKRCLVVGGGPIGHLCAQVLARRGHQVVVYDRSPVRLSYFEGTAIRATQTLDGVAEFEALIDATGDPEALDRMLHESSAGATILLLGLPYARREFSFEALVSYDKTVVGSVGSSHIDFAEAIEILPSLNMSLFTQKGFRLHEFDQAWQVFRDRRFLKLQLAIDETLDSPRMS